MFLFDHCRWRRMHCLTRPAVAAFGGIKGMLGGLVRWVLMLGGGRPTVDLLAEIRAAFPAAPYPGDATLSDCWCEECAWSVRNLRGKSWKQLRVEDVGGDGGCLSHRAFRYYLPGLLCLTVQHPDEFSLSSEVNGRLVVHDRAGPEEAREVSETVRRLSPRQRRVLERFLLWLGGQGWQAPILVEAALTAVRDGRVVPYDSVELMRWCRVREVDAGA